MRRLVAAALLGVAGGLAAAVLFGRMRADLGLAGVLVAWDVAPSGATVLAFPPLGEVAAATHAAPARLSVTLERIDLESIRAFLDASRESRDEMIRSVTGTAIQGLRAFLLRLVLTAAAGGAGLFCALTSALGGRADARRAALAGASGALAMAAVIGLGWTTYDVNAFRSPVYSGAIEAVPWIVDTVEEALVRFEELDQRLRAISSNLYRMYRQVESLPPSAALADADVVVLHVSDFHNHPSAAGIVRDIARSFGVDFIVNTGDLTDFGTVLETELLEGLSRIGAPHLFVSGNHETPAVLAKIESLPAVELIDGRQVELAGLLVAGLPDPGAGRQSAESLTPAEALAHAQTVNERLASMAKRPDILALHNFRTAQGIAPGLVPAVLFGHSHTAGVQFRSGTAYVNAGTTGGAGIRGLEANQTVPITLAVVYFKRLDAGRNEEAPNEGAPAGEAQEGGARQSAAQEGDAQGQEAQGPRSESGPGAGPQGVPGHFRSRVVAVDILRLSPYAGGFTLERHLAPR